MYLKATVLVDTLGRADMRTFTVVEASNPWFGQNLRSVIGRWRFTPAMVAGCKVPRLYTEEVRVAARVAPQRAPARRP
jgi:hypothetical protein